MKVKSTTPIASGAVRGDATRESLIRAATEVFARGGFEAVSTREIAEQAGANQALIGYHFGGKEGLYLAVFESIAAQALASMTPRIQDIESLLQASPPTDSPAARRRRWLPPILDTVDTLLGLMLTPQTEHWAQLILREQAHPTEAFDRLYNGFQGRLLELLTALVWRLRPDQDETDAHLRVIAIIGEVIAWRATRATAARLLGGRELDAAMAERIRLAVRRNVTAVLMA